MNNETEIKNTIHQYIEGYLNADADKINQAFHSQVKLMSVDEGQLGETSMSEWTLSLNDRKQKQDIRTANADILKLDITGNAATVKLNLTFPKFKFTDYLSLLKLENRWVIVGKIYEVESISS